VFWLAFLIIQFFHFYGSETYALLEQVSDTVKISHQQSALCAQVNMAKTIQVVVAPASGTPFMCAFGWVEKDVNVRAVTPRSALS
jgi:hypothetical protein